ncbi:hypothetical protein BDR03DRAFT_121377 [Suillus americanus]|nr:hypothetical protein BDR03DRAFT_121377 [Suillus americanus]
MAIYCFIFQCDEILSYILRHLLLTSSLMRRHSTVPDIILYWRFQCVHVPGDTRIPETKFRRLIVHRGTRNRIPGDQYLGLRRSKFQRRVLPRCNVILCITVQLAIILLDNLDVYNVHLAVLLWD